MLIGKAKAGPVVETFDPHVLADALNHEIARCVEKGLTHVMMNMALSDAMKLAQVLRRSPQYGHPTSR